MCYVLGHGASPSAAAHAAWSNPNIWFRVPIVREKEGFQNIHVQIAPEPVVFVKQKSHYRYSPGIFDGALLRVPGKGEAGERGQTPGDFLLRVHVMPDKRFST
jgi:hypothetical protein